MNGKHRPFEAKKVLAGIAYYYLALACFFAAGLALSWVVSR